MQPDQTPRDNVIRMTENDAPPAGGATAPPGGRGGPPAEKKKRTSGSINLGNYTRLMEAFSLIYGTKTVWDEESHRIVPIDALRLAMTSDAVKAWLNTPTRRMVMPEQLMFEPGEDLPPGCIQLFAGLELEPMACNVEDCKPMLDLLRHLCGDSADTADGVRQVMHWVLCWMAYPLQHLGAKMATAVVMHGPQGTGKNLFWDAWRDLFGRYGVTVGQVELEDKFNGWLSQKLAIIGDEVVSRQEMYHNKNRLKLIVTQREKFPIREIQQATRWESNHCNVVFLSNESQPLALEERDRRYTVIYTPLAADAELYARVTAFLRADGLRKWMAFLQAYPLGDFSEHTKPPITRAKSDLIQAGWLPAQRFAAEWMDGYLPLPRRLCSAEQLYRAFSRWCHVRGERFPPPQAKFTADVSRWMRERTGGGSDGPPLRVKPVQLREAQGRSSARCWVPMGEDAPDGMTEGAWAMEGVAAFERSLKAYMRDVGGGSDHDEDMGA